MASIPAMRRDRINLWSGMKKAGMASAPHPSLEAPWKSVSHTPTHRFFKKSQNFTEQSYR
jgi:hypothetical protein